MREGYGSCLVCLYPSVPALAASASGKQRYSRVSLRILLGGFSKNPSVGVKKPIEFTASRFRALSGPTKGSNDLKDNCLVECCVID